MTCTSLKVNLSPAKPFDLLLHREGHRAPISWPALPLLTCLVCEEEEGLGFRAPVRELG